MNEYIKNITEAHYFPTLTERCRQLARQGTKPVPSEIYGTRGEAIQEAGERFLKRIHQEIFFYLPEHEKDEIIKDMEALARESVSDKIPEVKAFRPALTPEYLKSIGREDILNWGTDDE